MTDPMWDQLEADKAEGRVYRWVVMSNDRQWGKGETLKDALEAAHQLRVEDRELIVQAFDQPVAVTVTMMASVAHLPHSDEFAETGRTTYRIYWHGNYRTYELHKLVEQGRAEKIKRREPVLRE